MNADMECRQGTPQVPARVWTQGLKNHTQHHSDGHPSCTRHSAPSSPPNHPTDVIISPVFELRLRAIKQFGQAFSINNILWVRPSELFPNQNSFESEWGGGEDVEDGAEEEAGMRSRRCVQARQRPWGLPWPQ